MTVKLQILNSDFRLLTVIENTNKNLPLLSATQNESLQPLNELLFTVPEKEEDSVYIKIGNYALYRDIDSIEHLFIISMVEEVDANYKNVHCEHISTELADEHITVIEKTLTTASECLHSIMSGSDWKVGIVEDFGYKSFNLYYTNRLHVLNEFANTFGGELMFETSITLGQVEKKVHLIKGRGTYTGKRFEYGKDILNIRRTVDMSEVKTAIYGYGTSSLDDNSNKQRLTFKDVVWSTSNGHPTNKPLGQTFVGDNTARSLYGKNNGQTHRYGMLDAGEVTDPEILINLSYAYLNRVNKPKITYEMSVIELERIAGYEHEKVRLGDTVVVLDYEFKVPIKVTARIIEIRRDLLNTEKTEIVLGNFKEIFSDIYDKINDLEDAINNNTGIWNNKLDSLDLDHYGEFGMLIYEGTTSTVMEFNFAQVYIEVPVIHVQMQLLDEEIDSVDEVVTFTVKPINQGAYYTGGSIKVNRADSTQRRFAINIQSFCSTPLDTIN
ncbi:phage tail protein [Halalkalibacter alkalisediminis]|uniref:Phage tail spike protein n=1 Tax=Halalkalibacter alkalisediminis TaxID=935616 RepID=A0ABV6NG68_9BACI|nr:phage tail protein [Halalkalibacter alkalisediminis]